MATHRFDDDAHLQLTLPADAFSTQIRQRYRQVDGTMTAMPLMVTVEGNTFKIYLPPDAAIELHAQLSKVISHHGLTGEGKSENTL